MTLNAAWLSSSTRPWPVLVEGLPIAELQSWECYFLLGYRKLALGDPIDAQRGTLWRKDGVDIITTTSLSVVGPRYIEATEL
ncbi:hypothetical protein NITHO_500014 [Nitrolancea hollandica Lb]|uniref:Uncharacterized protein n=1 Tax=Nitrolancea hollandica Lb TaxID=1129897 RepID=I4ELB7_9BACT|nr:hypothetical protein NITHO_500014 [Nitrolancea hollandica Lb]